MGVRIYLSVRLDQFNTLNLHSRFLSRGVLTLNVYYKYIEEKPLTPPVWLCVQLILYSGIIKNTNMQLELKKIPSQIYEGKMALRYGFWTPTGELKTKLKFTYHFDDSWFNDSICLSVYTMEANEIDYKNDLLVVLKDNNIKYQTKTTGPNKWIIINKGDFIKRKTKRK